MICNYFFDLGNVLLDIDPQRSLDAFAPLFKPDALKQFSPSDLFGVGSNPFLAAYQVGTISSDEFFAHFLPFCLPGTAPWQLVAAWNAMLINIPPRRIQAIRKLRQNGCKVFILSNINEEHLRWVRRHFDQVGLRLGSDIDDAFFSNEIHLSKPDPRIFAEAIRRSNVSPQETLFIDDQQINVSAACEAGLHAVCASRDAWLPFIRIKS